MPTFTYKAKRNPGEIHTGSMNAESQTSVINRLRQMGYHPVLISQERAGGLLKEVSVKMFRRVSSQDITVFIRQLSNLIEAGMPLASCLNTLLSETENPRLIEIIEDLRDYIEQGHTFSEALARHPKIFPPLYVSMVNAGETGGMLDEVLNRLADFSEKDQEIKGKIRAAMAYPVLLAVVGIATIFVLVSFVIPRFVTMFHDLGQILPLPTRILINLSNFMNSYWWLVIASILVIFFITKKYSNTAKGKLNIDRFRLKIPLIGEVIRKVEISKFARTLGTLLENGVPILSSLQIVAKTIANRVIANEVSQAHQEVKEGAKLIEPLRKGENFPPRAINLISIGEESGSMEKMLLKVAQTYDQEVDRAAKALTSLLEPAMILILGGCVAFIVVAMLLPIFQVNVLMK